MGNANSGRRERFFLTALLMELKSAGKDMPQLRNIARQLISQAEQGDLTAIREFLDRLDGKAIQAVDVSGHVESRAAMSDAELEAIASQQAQTESIPSKLN